MEQAIEAGASDVEFLEEGEEGAGAVIKCDPQQLGAIRKALEQAGVKVQVSEIVKAPTSTVAIKDDEVSERWERLYDALEENEDVQTVYHNRA
jgi:transcriptional/translational regulatory protein YebC/TACO1